MKEKNINLGIWVLSIVVPVLVAILLFAPKITIVGFNYTFLPTLNASINFTVSVLLLAGVYFVKQKNIKMHKTMMLAAFVLSSIFLLSYVTYHAQAPETKFGGEGFIRYIYLFILLSHISLSISIVPLALFTIYNGINGNIAKHKALAKFTFPIWFYISVTGVLVYILISPYYPWNL